MLILAGIPMGITAWAWSLAQSADCAELPREDLTLYEMGQLRRTIDRYKSNPAEPMALTPRQASFLLREQFKIATWMTVAGDQVLIEIRQPRPEGAGCWNVAFRGRFDVRDSVAHVAPTDLTIGRLHLGRIASWLPWRFRPADIPDPHAADLLAHLAAVNVSDGWFHVKVDDPRWIE